MAERDVCCGFGGTFCVKYPDISNVMVGRQDPEHRRDRRRAGAGGRSRLPDEHGRQGEPRGAGVPGAARGRGAGGRPRRRRRSESRHEPARGDDAGVQGQRPRGARRRQPAGGAAGQPRQLRRRSGPRRARRCRSSTRCATGRGTSRTHVLAEPRPLPRGLRGGRWSASGGVVHWAETAEDARRDRARHLPQGRGEDRQQGQDDDLRGVRDQRLARRRTASRRSRPTSASTSSSCAARSPSHIIAPAVHVTVPEVEAAFRKAHTAPRRRTGSLSEYSDLLRRGARACCGRSTSRPRSGSPGRTC